MKARLIPWSSVVGQSISLTDDADANLCQLSVRYTGRVDPSESDDAFKARVITLAKAVADAVNASPKHAVGSSAEEVAELRRLLDEATPGPWRYRPWEHDDWGLIRSAHAMPVAVARMGHSRFDHDGYLDECRRTGADPYEPNAALIVAAVNALPRLLAAAEALPRVEAERDEARAAILKFGEGDRVHVLRFAVRRGDEAIARATASEAREAELRAEVARNELAIARLRLALRGAINAVDEHNADYHHSTGEDNLARWRAALSTPPADNRREVEG